VVVQAPAANSVLLASAAAAALLSGAPALADVPTPPPQVAEAIKPAQKQSLTFPSSEAPAPKASGSSLPEGNQWRYSDFLQAVENGKVERVRFSKDGSQLQLTAVDGRRAAVVIPNDPDLVDTLARNGVDISVSEGEQQGSLVALLGNLLFPLIAFAGLFFLFRRANNGSNNPGGMGGGAAPSPIIASAAANGQPLLSAAAHGWCLCDQRRARRLWRRWTNGLWQVQEQIPGSSGHRGVVRGRGRR
jgi:hypothetical protein